MPRWPSARRWTASRADPSTDPLPFAPDGTPIPAPSAAPSGPAEAIEMAVAERHTSDTLGTIVDVGGTVLVRAARVRITLRDADSRTVDGAFIDVSDPDGGIRPVRTPTFMASFDLAGAMQARRSGWS